jgi:hypothetical protein
LLGVLKDGILTCCEVCNVAKHVKDGNQYNGNEAIYADGANGVLDLVDHVEGVLISCIRKYNVDQGYRKAVAAIGCSFESVLEVDARLRDSIYVATKDHEAGDADAARVVSDDSEEGVTALTKST